MWNKYHLNSIYVCFFLFFSSLGIFLITSRSQWRIHFQWLKYLNGACYIVLYCYMSKSFITIDLLLNDVLYVCYIYVNKNIYRYVLLLIEAHNVTSLFCIRRSFPFNKNQRKMLHASVPFFRGLFLLLYNNKY